MVANLSSSYAEAQRTRQLDVFYALRQGGFGAVFKMFNRYFLKSLFGPFYLFAMPLIIYGILGKLLGHQYLLPGIAAMGVTLASSASMPFSILELRRSVVLKRIGSSPVRPSLFSMVIISYFMVMNTLATAWLMLWSLIFFQDAAMFKPLGTVNGFFGFLYGVELNSLLSIALGFTIATFAKNSLIAQSMGLSIAFPAAFLSGQIIWIGMLSGSKGFTIASQVFPFRYTSMYMYEGWNGDVSAPVFEETTNKFAVGADGVVQTYNISNARPFDIHDYYLVRNNLPNPTDYNNNYDLLAAIPTPPGQASAAQQYKDTVIGTYRPEILVYSKLDHILGYVVPYAYTALYIVLPAFKFSWVDR